MLSLRVTDAKEEEDENTQLREDNAKLTRDLEASRSEVVRLEMLVAELTFERSSYLQRERLRLEELEAGRLAEVTECTTVEKLQGDLQYVQRMREDELNEHAKSSLAMIAEFHRLIETITKENHDEHTHMFTLLINTKQELSGAYMQTAIALATIEHNSCQTSTEAIRDVLSSRIQIMYMLSFDLNRELILLTTLEHGVIVRTKIKMLKAIQKHSAKIEEFMVLIDNTLNVTRDDQHCQEFRESLLILRDERIAPLQENLIALECMLAECTNVSNLAEEIRQQVLTTSKEIQLLNPPPQRNCFSFENIQRLLDKASVVNCGCPSSIQLSDSIFNESYLSFTSNLLCISEQSTRSSELERMRTSCVRLVYIDAFWVIRTTFNHSYSKLLNQLCHMCL